MKLHDIKTALITGATSELALCLAATLADHDCTLILSARDKPYLLEATQLLKKKTHVVPHIGDLREAQCRQELIALIHEHSPDLLINNAGIGLYGPALMHAVSEQIDILKINAEALLELTLEYAKHMKHAGKKGVVLNVSSSAGFFSYPTFCVYSASKAFVSNFSQGFDDEMKPFNIRILAACPGQIETGFRIKAAKNYPQKPGKQVLSPAKAAKLLLKQVEKEKPLYIFDWRYRIALFVSRWLVPEAFICNILKRSIADRYRKLDY